MDRLANDQAVLRWIAVIGGVLAIIVSFPQLRWVYEDYIGMPVWAAYLVPLMIDLLAVMFAGVVGTTVGAPPRARLYSWAGLGVFVAVSVAGNAMHAWWHRTGEYLPSGLAANEGWVLLIFAAMPPIGAALGIHGRSFLDRVGVDADRAADTSTPAAHRAPSTPDVARKPAQEPARTARTTVRAPATPVRAPAAQPTTTTKRDTREAARDLFGLYGPGRGVGARIHRELKEQGFTMPTTGAAPDSATVRRWVQEWTTELEEADRAATTTPTRHVA